MPQQSTAFAVGRVSVLLRERMDASRVDRLMAAPTLDEALKTLQEFGWRDEQAGDYEQAISNYVRKAYEFVREVTPDERVTDCFFAHLDVHNLKTLLKARCLSQPAQHLYAYGLISVEKLRHAVEERKYSFLPEALAKALDGLEARLAVREDPLDIDITLDKAMFAWIFERLSDAPSSAAHAYFRAKVDLLNAMMLLRTLKMAKDRAFFERLRIAGGHIDCREWQDAFEKPQALPRLLSRYGAKVLTAAQAAASEGRLAGLEKAADDYLLSLFAAKRADPLSLEPVIAYLLLREREAAAVRLILAGKANGFSQEAVSERLCELYA